MSKSHLKDSQDFSEQRINMVKQQLVARDVRDKNVLAAMRTVPRHLFVSKKYRDEAYSDGPLPIGKGQTISQPYIVASMTEHLEISSKSRVLEIGTGCGYQTAVLAEIAKDVYSIEIIPKLHETANSIFKELYYKNIYTRLADGSEGWADKAPFDAIIITAAAPKIPEKLIEQLALNGKMLLPIQGGYFDQQDLFKITKTKDGLTQKSLYGVRFVPMTGNISK